jgi:hypothetical protein
MNLRDLQAQSASPRELVLAFETALIAVETLEASGARLLGWEGWLRRADGSLGHSAMHPGTVSLGGRNADQSYSVVRHTIREAQRQHLEAPELAGSQLLFCISYDD